MVECHLSEIPSEVQIVLRETVREKVGSEKCKICVTSASQSGDNNFIGVVYRILYNKDDDSNEKLRNENDSTNPEKLILKVAPQNTMRRAHFFSRACFLREIYMYEKVLPFFHHFEQSKGIIVEENGLHEYPKCYRTIDIEPYESVFLEDLSVREFTMIDRFTQEVTADHVRLVMQCLGKLHAISFAVKDQQPTKFMELIAPLKEVFLRAEDEWLSEFFLLRARTVKELVSGDIDAHLLARIKKLFEVDPMKIAANCIDVDLTGSAAIITHGDSWQNNIMFRYDNNGKPIEICLIDWQILRCASPIIDIVYYIFCCTTKELRDAHYDDFLKIYHGSLSAHIRKLGSDPEKFFPYELMLEHFHKFAKFGLILATVLLPMLTADSGSGVDLDEIAVDMTEDSKCLSNAFITDKSQTKLNKRLRDVVVDMVRLNYI